MDGFYNFLCYDLIYVKDDRDKFLQLPQETPPGRGR